LSVDYDPCVPPAAALDLADTTDRDSADRSPIDSAVAAARFFKVLSDPTRLAILRLLAERERNVAELTELLGVSQSRVSNHLACLRWCHFVEVTRQSRRAIYRIADERLLALLGDAAVLGEEHARHLESCARIGPAWV
jgi:DNA-binding transcriptional ArsR family regulator